jgi:hypothetical protein
MVRLYSPAHHYERPTIGHFRVHPGRLKYIGDVFGTGCGGVFGGSLGVSLANEWESVRPKLAERFPALDPAQVYVDLFSPEPGITTLTGAGPREVPDIAAASPAPGSPAGWLVPPLQLADAGAPVSVAASAVGPSPRPPPWSGRPPWELAPRRPTWSIGLLLGFAGGGDDLITARLSDGSEQTLTAGAGVSICGSLARGLFGVGRHAALIGVEAGVKGWNIGGEDANYNIQLIRFPVVPHLRYLYGDSPGMRLLAAAGLHYERGVELSGSGAASGIDASFDRALGWMVDMGTLIETVGFNAVLSLRYTRLHYQGGGLRGRANASNIGLFLGLGWGWFANVDGTP